MIIKVETDEQMIKKVENNSITCPSKDAIQAPVWTRGPSLPRAKPPPTEPMLPNICGIVNLYTKKQGKAVVNINSIFHP